MQVKVLGISQVKFTNNNGETINGTNLYCGYKDENTVGIRADKFFLKDGIQVDCKPNDTIELVFNMRGKVESVHKVQSTVLKRKIHRETQFPMNREKIRKMENLQNQRKEILKWKIH